MALIAGYAYPTSAYAAACKASDTGCYVVERTHNVKTGAPLAAPVLAVKLAFKTEADAQKWADSWAS